nr:DUF3037 superfamily protein [uncultured bacterium]
MSEQILSYYCMARYVPDPIKAESMNFGVFVLAAGRARFQGIGDWTRLRKFGGEPIDFLKEFARSAKAIEDEQYVRHIAIKWKNSIQITEPQPSLMAPEPLLVYAAQKFLVETGPAGLGYRRKSDLVRATRLKLREALVLRLGSVANIYLKQHYSIPGESGSHTFDFGVANGSPYFLAQAISFEIADPREIEKQVDAASWAVDDVKRSVSKLPIGVVTLPPKAAGETSDMYGNAKKVLNRLGAEVLDEVDVQAWATRMADLVPLAPKE